MPITVISHYKEAWLEKKYKDCWLIMDREESASDNGYALYKYLLEKHPEINAYFAISRDSEDVTKLQEEGFRLVFVGSNEHKIAIRNSKKLFYSYFTFEYSNEAAQRIFLGHGITKDDLPNPGIRANDYFITAIDREQGYLSERTDLRAIKVGLPRYERLVEKLKCSEEKKDSIIIAPTWRLWLYLDSHKTKKNEYFINWQRFLDSKELKALSHEYKIIFILHPMMNEANSFNVPEYIESNTYSNLGLDGLQDLLIKTELLITDYSSIAFDATVAGANIMYFQFDREDFRRKGKLKTGWFSYEEDGFGPVCDGYNDFINKVKEYKGVTSDEYQERSQLFRDEIINTTNVSERIVQLIGSEV